jgi:hypothetical protein
VILAADDTHGAHCFLVQASGGLIQPQWCSADFTEVMRSLPEDFPPEAYTTHPDLLLHTEGPLQLFFTPFDHVPGTGKVVLVTP